MTWNATGRYKCDGCKVVESDPIELPSELLGPDMPATWLRVETRRHNREINFVSVHHYCPGCAAMIEGILNGKATEGRH